MAELEIHVAPEEMLFLEEDTSLSESTGGQPSTTPVHWKIPKRPDQTRSSFHRSPLLAVAPPRPLPSFDFGPACCGPLVVAPSEPPAAAPSDPPAAAPSEPPVATHSEPLAAAPLEPQTVSSAVRLAVATEPAWQHLPSHPVSSTGPYRPGPSRTVKRRLRRMRAHENSTQPSLPHPYVRPLPTRPLKAEVERLQRANSSEREESACYREAETQTEATQQEGASTTTWRREAAEWKARAELRKEEVVHMSHLLEIERARRKALEKYVACLKANTKTIP